LIDPDTKYAEIPAGARPAKGDALIDGDKDHPIIVVAANGGSDLAYIPNGDRNMARRAVEVLSAQDYVSGIVFIGCLTAFLEIKMRNDNRNRRTPRCCAGPDCTSQPRWRMVEMFLY
jgi:hypothetical protein